MCTQVPRSSSRRGEKGFALILALLALLLLTFLGLTLAVTTSTELQIATNYRWSEQARYVAEAGVEVAKVRLRGVVDWNSVLPPLRDDPVTGSWSGDGTPATPPAPRVVGGVTMRDYENASCDQKGNGMGFGWVLVTANEPQQYVSSFGSLQLTGAFTVWVRRPLWVQPTGSFTDWGREITGPPLYPATNENLVMVVEGVAPYTSATALSDASSTLVAKSKAVYLVELPFSRIPPVISACETSRTGQTGHGSHNTGFGGCEPLGANAMDAARSGSNSTGSGNATAER